MQRRTFLRQMSFAAALPLAFADARGWAAILGRGPADAADARLDADERAFVSAFAEALIPSTDTPGAIGAGVPDFLALLYSEWLLPEEQLSFSSGIAQLNQLSRQASGQDFALCSGTSQLTLLQQWDGEAHTARRDGRTTGFYARLRSLVLIAYYSSELGQTQELKMQYGAGADRAGGPVFGAVPFKI